MMMMMQSDHVGIDNVIKVQLFLPFIWFVSIIDTVIFWYQLHLWSIRVP